MGREAASSLSVGDRKRGAYVGRQTDSGVGTKDGGWDDVSPNYIYIYSNPCMNIVNMNNHEHYFVKRCSQRNYYETLST